jgi:hypothetical protein
VHADTAEIKTASLAGAHYFVVLIDEWSNYVCTLFTASKDQIADSVIQTLKQWQTLHNRTVVEFHTDGGTEFVNQKLSKFFSAQGTTHTITTPHTPQHDGKSEREVRTATEWAHALLAQIGAHRKFWALAIATATHMRNRTLLIKNTHITPYERWTGTSPFLSDLHVWGCDADVVHTVAPGHKLPKLTPKSRLCMFVGYAPDRMAHLFYDPQRATVIASRDAKFYEQQYTVATQERLMEEAAEDNNENEESVDEWLTRTALDGEIRLAQLLTKEESNNASAPSSTAAGSHSPPDSSDSIVTDSAPASVPPSAVAATSTRRSTRTRFEPNRYGMIGHNLAQGHLAVYVGLVAADDARVALRPSAVTVPRTFDEAMQSGNWRAAIHKELESHISNNTWSLTQLPPGCKAIGTKWVFALKLRADGSIDRYKARLTAQGFAQREGVDYNETFAPVLHYTTLRIILAYVAAEDYELHQLDVETAFLNASVKENLYMKVPAGLEATDPGTVCKLNKALYGIKQAPHEWHAEIALTLLHLGYARAVYDPCLFLKRSRTLHLIIFPLFVDDSFPAFHLSDTAELQSDISYLQSKYKLKYNETPSLVLGMRLTRNREKRSITLDQEVYIRRIIEENNMGETKEVKTPEIAIQQNNHSADPSSSSFSASAALDSAHPSLLSAERKESYAALVGALQYAAISTRPDIFHSVNTLARALVSPTTADESAAYRTLCYLKGTASLGITLGGELNSRQFVAYCDANWAGEKSTARSTSGWLMKIGNGPVSWNSKRQSIVALSSAESEYIAAATAAQEVVWIRGLLTDLGIGKNTSTLSSSTHDTTPSPPSPPTPLFCDNTAVKALAESQRHHQRTKHINVRYHYIRDLVSENILSIQWISTLNQPADLFTKPLPTNIFIPLRKKVMGKE